MVVSAFFRVKWLQVLQQRSESIDSRYRYKENCQMARVFRRKEEKKHRKSLKNEEKCIYARMDKSKISCYRRSEKTTRMRRDHS